MFLMICMAHIPIDTKIVHISAVIVISLKLILSCPVLACMALEKGQF